MYENQTEELIRERMLSRVPQGINTSEGDFFYDAVSPAAIELTLVYQQLEEALKVGFAETAYDGYLDKITSERGILRKPATKGSGAIEVIMAVGAKISVGDVLATWQGNVRFVATETKVAGETGKILVNFENEMAGSLGNILPGTAFIAPVAIPGFISAKNLEQINSGTDMESDESLRGRYFEKVQTPATSGNKHHYRNWAKEVAGVGDARVFPLWNGSNTVKVVIIDSNKQPASAELISDVQNHIDPEPHGYGAGQAPIGAYCTVVSAVGIPINVTATVNGAKASDVKPLFEEALKGYLADIAFTNSSVSYARINTILLDCISQLGGADHTGLTVNNAAGNIPLQPEQVAVIGTVTLNEP